MLLKTFKFSFIGQKTLWEKKKMLVTSIFFFSHNVFKSLFAPAHQKSSLCGKGLIHGMKMGKPVNKPVSSCSKVLYATQPHVLAQYSQNPKKPTGKILTLYHIIPTFNHPVNEAVRKDCRKRRKCW